MAARPAIEALIKAYCSAGEAGAGPGLAVGAGARVKGLGLGVGWVAPSGFAAAAACRGTTLEGVAARSPHMALIKAYCSAGEAWAGSGLAVRARARVSG